MSSEVAIRVRGLGKRYAGGERARYETLRDFLSGVRAAPASADVVALDDVSFDLARGRALGIVGDNGAGKSTLLKILARITRPSSGRIELTGRVGALLELGTGFHPELTGRENVYLNGSILGMRRREVDAKLDSIVAFAGAEASIDRTVRVYSTGMYLRLAFAVAAHLDTDILLVDEVLAVGDVGFQRKCAAKMREVIREGRTVVVVSHAMDVLRDLCSDALFLEHGRVRAFGSSGEVLESYLANHAERGVEDGQAGFVGGADSDSVADSDGVDASTRR